MTAEKVRILYAVKGADFPIPKMDGVAGNPLESETVGSLSLVFETGDRLSIEDLFSAENLSDMTKLEPLVMRHQAIQISLWEAEPAVPFRFGTVVPSLDPLTKLLAANNEEAVEKLTWLSDKAEIGLQVILKPQTQAAPQPETSQDDGRNYLRAIKAGRQSIAQQQANQESFIESLLTASDQKALASIQLPTGRQTEDGGSLIINTSFLIDRSVFDSFVGMIADWQEQADQHGLMVRTIGPLPPQSFAVLDFLADAELADGDNDTE